MTRLALALVLVHGALWSWFLRVLSQAGHVPSGPLVLPIARESYYAAESLFVLPVQATAVVAQTLAMHLVARRLGGTGTLAASFECAALSSAGASLLLWLLPDVVVYATAGFDALAPALRYTVPAFALGAFALATLLAARRHELTRVRALLVAFAGGAVYALVSTPFLR